MLSHHPGSNSHCRHETVTPVSTLACLLPALFRQRLTLARRLISLLGYAVYPLVKCAAEYTKVRHFAYPIVVVTRLPTGVNEANVKRRPAISAHTGYGGSTASA